MYMLHMMREHRLRGRSGEQNSEDRSESSGGVEQRAVQASLVWRVGGNEKSESRQTCTASHTCNDIASFCPPGASNPASWCSCGDVAGHKAINLVFLVSER